MNHQIEHHVDIERARSEHAQPVHFKKHGLGDERRSGAHRRIEALQVPDLRDAIQTLRQADQFVGLGQRRGHRLFHQHVDAGLHERARCLQVPHRGYGHRGGLHFAVRGDQLLDRAKCAATEFAGHSVGPRHIRVHHSHQANRFALLCQLVIDAGVVAPEGAHADHCDVNKVVRQL